MRFVSTLILLTAVLTALDAAPTSSLVELEGRGLRKGFNKLFHKKASDDHPKNQPAPEPRFRPFHLISDSLKNIKPVSKPSAVRPSGQQQQQQFPVIQIPTAKQILAAGYKVTSVPEIKPGVTRYDKYVVLGRLGSGAYGDVDLGWDGQKYVAIKFVRPDKFDQVQFDHEAAMQNMLTGDSYAVQLFSTIEDIATGKKGMIMEAANAGDLRHYVDDRDGLKEDEARYLFQSLAIGLWEAHKKNVAIRDIKPDNVLLFKNIEMKRPVPKYADFGLSSKLEKLSRGWAGSPAYLPSEAFEGTGYDLAKADVYSLGVTLFYMLTPNRAEIPREQTRDAFGKRHMTQFDFTSTDYTTLAGKYPRAASLIRHMVDPDPTTRFTTAQVLKHDWVNSGAVVQLQQK